MPYGGRGIRSRLRGFSDPTSRRIWLQVVNAHRPLPGSLDPVSELPAQQTRANWAPTITYPPIEEVIEEDADRPRDYH